MHILSPIAMFFSFLLLSCGSEPEPIHYGKDSCDHCRMTIMDPKFGAEIVTNKGKVYKFDDVNCLVRFMADGKVAEADVNQILVADFAKPETLMPVEAAFFVKSEEIRSPMASRVAAFSDTLLRAKQVKKWSGNPMNWPQVKAEFE